MLCGLPADRGVSVPPPLHLPPLGARPLLCPAIPISLPELSESAESARSFCCKPSLVHRPLRSEQHVSTWPPGPRPAPPPPPRFHLFRSFTVSSACQLSASSVSPFPACRVGPRWPSVYPCVLGSLNFFYLTHTLLFMCCFSASSATFSGACLAPPRFVVYSLSHLLLALRLRAWTLLGRLGVLTLHFGSGHDSRAVGLRPELGLA